MTSSCNGEGNTMCRICWGVITVGCTCGRAVKMCDCAKPMPFKANNPYDAYVQATIEQSAQPSDKDKV